MAFPPPYPTSVCMSSTFCINGVFLKPEDAVVSAMDRGFLFGDGIYEVMAVIGGQLIEFERHWERLLRSLGEIAIDSPYDRESFLAQCRGLVQHAQLTEGYIYVQITRGADAVRDFAFPKGVKPTTVLFSRAKDLHNNPLIATGASLVSVPDLRWARRDIKSVSLLAQVLAKQAAQERGANEAVMVDAAGMVTEGSSSSLLLVDEQGNLVVKPLSHAILPGCTRAAVLALAAQKQLPLVERDFSLAECLRAREVLLTSALHFVLPVTRIDEQPVGNGQPGPLAAELRQLYLKHAVETAI